MREEIVCMGIISAIFKYSIEDDMAIIHELWLGGAEAVRFPLTDWWDIENFSKMLTKAIGLDVKACIEVAA